MKKFVINIWNLFKSIFIPLVFLIGIGYLLLRIVNISDKEMLNVVLGVALGIMLGFIVNILKDAIDEFRSQNKLKKIALRLLEQDARKIHRTVWLYSRLLEDLKVPKEVKKQIPPVLELRYWSRLNQNNDFLLLGSESPFDKIFSELWEFEKINEQIYSATSEKDNKQAYILSMVFYKKILDDQDHKNFLSYFIDKKKIDEIEKDWIKIAKKNI